MQKICKNPKYAKTIFNFCLISSLLEVLSHFKPNLYFYVKYAKFRALLMTDQSHTLKAGGCQRLSVVGGKQKPVTKENIKFKFLQILFFNFFKFLKFVLKFSKELYMFPRCFSNFNLKFLLFLLKYAQSFVKIYSKFFQYFSNLLKFFYKFCSNFLKFIQFFFNF